MRRLSAVALTLAVLAPAFAQTTVTSTVTADATEVVRVKPDQAKVYVTATGRNQDATTASDEAADQAKKFAAAVKQFKVNGLKVATDPVKVVKVTEDRARGFAGPGGPGGGPSEMHAQQQVVVTVSDADPKALTDAVEKVQREAVREGLTGGVADGLPVSSRYTTDTVRVAYSRQDGQDELMAAALTKATKKATARAEAIAAGLGMKLGAVVSADEMPGGSVASADPSVSTAFGLTSSARTTTAAGSELVEGELVRTVRVRVVFAVVK